MTRVKDKESRSLKENVIIEAAIKVFATKGYPNAKIENVAKEANVATGLIYFYFSSKLNLLLCIFLRFWNNLNHLVEEEIFKYDDPKDQLFAILTVLQNYLMQSKESLYLAKVLNETLPEILKANTRKDRKLKINRDAISKENRKFLDLIDNIIIQGQVQGRFDKSLNPSVMRQALYGAIEMILYGLFLRSFKKVEVKYNQTDARKAIEKLINKFLSA